MKRNLSILITLLSLFSKTVEAQVYCSENYTYGTTVGDFISGVSLGSIYNNTGASSFPYYSYYNSQSTNLSIGSTDTLYLATGTATYGNYYSFLIDYNNDGDFLDNGEYVGYTYNTAVGQIYYFPFTVPLNAKVGKTRLRVVCTDLIYNYVCGTYGYGETEDYNLNIVDPANVAPSITLQPIDSVTICSSTINYDTIYVLANGGSLKYQWQQSASKNGTYTNVSGATNFYYVPNSSIVGLRYYKCIVSNSYGSQKSSETYYNVLQSPTLILSGKSTNLCSGVPDKFKVIATNAGSNPYYYWGLNNAVASYGFNDTYTPPLLKNNDTLIAFVINIENYCYAYSNYLPITVTTTNYSLGFTASSTSLSAAPFGVSFINNSTASSSVKYTWFFGDGTNYNGYTPPKHYYPSNGTYSVTLFAQDTLTKCSDTLRKNNYITCSGGGSSYNCIQTATITPSGNIAACQGGTASLTATTNAINPTYQWNLNGAPIGGASQNKFEASTKGIYSVTIYENGGCPVTSTGSIITFNKIPSKSPLLTVTGSLQSCTGNSVSIAASNGFKSYLWSNGATTQAITVSNAGAYSVIGTDGNGCSSQSIPSIITNATNITPPSICMVDVDVNTGKNVIVWDKSKYNSTQVDSFIIMRETIQYGIFKRIGAVAYSQLSEYVDNSPLSKPLVHADRYRIIARSPGGCFSLPGNIHRTMHLQVSPGMGIQRNCSWSNQEGQNITTYEVWAGNPPSVPFKIVDSVSASVNSWTDLNPIAGLNTVYRIKVLVHNGGCNSTKSLNTLKVRSTSNSSGNSVNAVPDSISSTVDIDASAIINSSLVRVIPNPSNGDFTVSLDILKSGNCKIELFDITGQKIQEKSSNVAVGNHIISFEQKASGMYFLYFKSEAVVVCTKVVIE